ncbi:MAG: hypothetical protein KAS12_07120, partial [Candidatus Aenigmarchaeota archaeon]|nr:hypothetical protein [Candidatus Aenigmarchaeota archaeon]
DTLSITGTLKNKNNKTINGATVIANLTGNANTSLDTTAGSGSYEIDFSWSDEAPGTKILTIRANDTNNNTATYTQTLYISNYINKTTVVVSGDTDNVFEYNEENVTITVNAMDSDNSKVYLGDVTLTGSAGTKTNKTDKNGIATFTFPAPKINTHSYTVTARSPLNTSTTAKIVNSSFGTYRSAWIYYENVTITPENPKVGQDITIAGEIYFTNESACTGGSVNIKVKRGSYERNATVTVTDNEFSRKFEHVGFGDESDAWDVHFVSDSWTYYLNGSLTSCKYYNRTFATITADDPSTRSDSFTVSTNTTTTSDDSSSGGDDDSSSSLDSCTKNSDCSAGDYCSTKKLCKPVSCADGIILDHKCISAYKITLSDYPKTISIEQGKSDKFNFSIKNTGYKTLTDLSASFVIAATTNLTNWYVLGNISETLETDKFTQTEAVITISENITIAAYPFKIKIISAEKTHEETMNLQVLPGDKEKIIINNTLETLGVEIGELKEDVDELVSKLNNSNSTSAKIKLETIEALHQQVKEAILKGDYLTAYNQEKEIETLLAQLTLLVEDNKLIVAASETKDSVILTVVILVIIIAGIFYYLWVPAPGYEPSNGKIPLAKSLGESNVKTNPPADFLTKLKLRINELIGEYHHTKEAEENAPPQYDYHKKKKWK